MNKNPKKKLCWNCEGNVSLAEETCPYCGVSVIPASLDGTTHGSPYRNSLYDHSIPRPPYAANAEESEESNPNSDTDSDQDMEEGDVPVDQFKSILLALLLLLGGSMFFLFGLTLALFSRNGIFTLQWDSSFWFLYSILSLPLLFFGWRVLNKLDDEKK